MDIDIVDSAFSLANVPIVTETANDIIESITEIVSASSSSSSSTTPIISDNSLWFYLGILFILLAISMFAYKSYANSSKTSNHVQFDDNIQDCPGGFCTMKKCI